MTKTQPLKARILQCSEGARMATCATREGSIVAPVLALQDPRERNFYPCLIDQEGFMEEVPPS